MHQRHLRSLRLGILALGAATGLFILFRSPRPSLVDTSTNPGRSTETVYGSKRVGQTFQTQAEDLTSIDIQSVLPLPPQTTVQFELRESDGGLPLRQLRGPLEQFFQADTSTLHFPFPRLSGVRDRSLTFTLMAPEAARQTPLLVSFEIASDFYRGGERRTNGVPRAGDLGFSVQRRGTFTESWGHHVLRDRLGQYLALVVIATLVALLLVEAGAPGTRWRWMRSALLGSIALSLLYTLPLYNRMALWAADESDWPEAASTLAATRATIAAGEFPGWNPFLCGGAPNFANPQTYALPFALPLSFIVGDVVATKLEYTIMVALGFVGMALLARTIGLRGAPAVLASSVFLLSGFTTTHLANGQLLWLTIAWVPWAVTGFLRSLSSRLWWTVASAGALIAIFVEGRVYLVAYVALLLTFLAIVRSWQGRTMRPLVSLALVGFLTVTGSAWKLLPTLQFLADTETSLPNTDGIPLQGLDETFLRRAVTPNITDTFGARALPRHEYAAYVGIIPLLLVPFALGRETRRRALPFFAAGAAFLFLATQRGDTSLLELLPLTRELRNPSRMVSMVVLAIALLAGFGLSNLARWIQKTFAPRIKTMLPAAVALAVTGDLILIGWTSFGHLFAFPPMTQVVEANNFYQTRLPERQPTNGYPTVAVGKGAKDFCPAVLHAYHPQSSIRAREDGGYQGEVFASGGSSVKLRRWTPNTLEVDVDAPAHDTLLVNQQYGRGWSAPPLPVISENGLLAVRVPAGHSTVRLRYRTPGVRAGAAVTLVTLGGLAIIWHLWRRRA